MTTPAPPAALSDPAWADVEAPPAAGGGSEHHPAAVDPNAHPEMPAAPDPGLFDMLHMETKNVFCMPGYFHDGAKFTFHRMVTENLVIGHQLSLGSTMRPQGYNFTATYLGPKRISPAEGYPLLMGDIDTAGSLTAKIVHQFRDNLKASFQAQSQGSFWAGAQAEVEYHGSSFGTSLKLVNVNPLKESGALVANYLQRLTENLSLGGEVMYKYGPSGTENTDFVLGGRYRRKDWSFCATASANLRGAVSYCHQITPKIIVGTELEVNVPRGEAIASVGMQYNFKQSVFRGQVNTQGEVAGVLFRSINPAVTFVLSGLVDHIQGKSQFGVGLMVEQ